jgi:hypothetical protein
VVQFHDHLALGASAGSLDEVDIQQVILSLMQNQPGLQTQALSDSLIETIAVTFPEYEHLFHRQA